MQAQRWRISQKLNEYMGRHWRQIAGDGDQGRLELVPDMEAGDEGEEGEEGEENEDEGEGEDESEGESEDESEGEGEGEGEEAEEEGEGEGEEGEGEGEAVEEGLLEAMETEPDPEALVAEVP